MLIGLFCRVKTLLITTSNNIVETSLQTIEIKKPTGFLISILIKKEFLGVQESLINTTFGLLDFSLKPFCNWLYLRIYKLEALLVFLPLVGSQDERRSLPHSRMQKSKSTGQLKHVGVKDKNKK